MAGNGVKFLCLVRLNWQKCITRSDVIFFPLVNSFISCRSPINRCIKRITEDFFLILSGSFNNLKLQFYAIAEDSDRNSTGYFRASCNLFRIVFEGSSHFCQVVADYFPINNFLLSLKHVQAFKKGVLRMKSLMWYDRFKFFHWTIRSNLTFPCGLM